MREEGYRATRTSSQPSHCAVTTLALLLAIPSVTAPSMAASLRPSRAGLLRQVDAASRNDTSYLDNASQIADFIAQGALVEVLGNGSYVLKEGDLYPEGDLLPYARPEVKDFLERLSEPYGLECGEPLVVTSLVRPRNRQPRNASHLSVHPTGMAMDLRLSWRRSCRGWLESALLTLEEEGALEAALERYPPHYHVVLFPERYQRYLERMAPRGIPYVGALPAGIYRVRRGDTLWKIAHRHGTTVEHIQEANSLPSTLLRPGQLLEVPRD